MRIIKFRCWDKVQGKMFDPSSLSWKNGTMWVCDAHGCNKLEYEMVHPNAEIMQFTGLFDKNGKEIYEGDVVNYKDFGSLKNDYVIYREELAKFILSKQNSFDLATYSGRYNKNGKTSLEIIGNIYENPNLITNSK